MANILIIDDEEQVRTAFSTALKSRGHDHDMAATLAEGLDMAARADYDVVLLDVNLPDANGLSGVREFTESPGRPEVIIITGYGGSDSAARAIREGAWDYVTKPPLFNELMLSIDRALAYRRQKSSGLAIEAMDRQGIAGESPEILSCLEQAALASSTLANVLITGESGTGKELFARAIHLNSKRKNQPLVVIDCGSLPENLAESLLFGHEKGSFTGADRRQTGYIQQAANGTLFMDEIGELTPMLQAKFLRVLQEKRFRPVGLDQELRSDFRLICATNRNLKEMVGQGGFREDLYYRIKSLTIELPPLRDHKQDIPAIVEQQVRLLCERYKMENKLISPDFFEALQSLEWPGNVRELNHVVELAVINSRDESLLFARHLPKEIRIKAVQESRLPAPTSGDGPEDPSPADQAGLRSASGVPRDWAGFRSEVVGSLEERYLKDLLEYTGGNVRAAAKTAGLGLSRFYELLRRHSIPTK